MIKYKQYLTKFTCNNLSICPTRTYVFVNNNTKMTVMTNDSFLNLRGKEC